MNQFNLTQRSTKRLSARTQFKSLLLLTMLTANASAQQSEMPAVALTFPASAPLSCPTVPSLEFATPPGLEPVVMVGVPMVGLDTSFQTPRSTWSLRQHASWLLGLRVRPARHDSIEPMLPPVPMVEIHPTAELSTAESSTAESSTVELPNSQGESTVADIAPNEIQLVQHTETQPAGPANNLLPDVVAPAVHAQENVGQVQHAHQTTPKGLNLRPVLSGPVPAVPLDAPTKESLMHVDVSGVDAARVALPQPPAQSLMVNVGIEPPVGFSMRDSDSPSVVASPSNAKPVSIFEGFAPRATSANQSSHLENGSQGPGSSDRLSISVPSAPHYTLNDQPSKPTTKQSTKPSTGPVLNRLSDKGPVHEKLGDQNGSDRSTKPGKNAIEKALSDKESLVAALPTGVTTAGVTARTGQPVELTPPKRSDAGPLKLPVPGVMPIASTGIDQSPAVQVAATESLVDGLVPASPPNLLSATEPTSLVGTSANKPMTSTQPAPPPKLLAKADDTKRAEEVKRADDVKRAEETKRTDEAKRAEKFWLSDQNPIALKRPVTKATNVALPTAVEKSEAAAEEPLVELDDADRQLAQYAKIALKMQQAVKQKYPSCHVKVTCNEDGLIAEGNVANNSEASKVLTYLRKTSLCPVVDRITTSQ